MCFDIRIPVLIRYGCHIYRSEMQTHRLGISLIKATLSNADTHQIHDQHHRYTRTLSGSSLLRWHLLHHQLINADFCIVLVESWLWTLYWRDNIATFSS